MVSFNGQFWPVRFGSQLCELVVLGLWELCYDAINTVINVELNLFTAHSSILGHIRLEHIRLHSHVKPVHQANELRVVVLGKR